MESVLYMTFPPQFVYIEKMCTFRGETMIILPGGGKICDIKAIKITTTKVNK